MKGDDPDPGAPFRRRLFGAAEPTVGGVEPDAASMIKIGGSWSS